MTTLPNVPLIDGHAHVGADLLFYLRGYHPYAQDWPTLVEAGVSNGIGRFVVFPMVTHLALDPAELREGRIASGGLEKVPYAFENRRLMIELTRRFPAERERALPLWMIDPSREPDAQVAALRELHGEFPCQGLKVQATILQSPVLDLLGSGACLLDLAEEKGWPLLFHTSVHPGDPWSQVGDILTLVKARPRLRFCLAHSCRYDLAALEEIAQLPNAWFDSSAHVIHCRLTTLNSPSVAPPARRFPSNYSDPTQVLADLAERYPTKLIWGSDAPFYSYADDQLQVTSNYETEAQILHALPKETVQRIAGSNTLSFLGLC